MGQQTYTSTITHVQIDLTDDTVAAMTGADEVIVHLVSRAATGREPAPIKLSYTTHKRLTGELSN